MNLIEQLQEQFYQFLTYQFSLPAEAINPCSFEINIDEQKQQFGDINSNASMVLAKKLGRAPRDIAQQITQSFSHTMIEKIEIAGPGFLNIYLAQAAWQEIITQITQQKEDFFKTATPTASPVSLEFVSANPTGPLHFGHGRGGIIGDVLGNVLRFLNNPTTKEFYINDAGSQIQKLGLSFKTRCQQELGVSIELPEDAYHGKYLVDLAKIAVKSYGSGILDESDEFFANYAKTQMLARIQHTLLQYGIQFDEWFSEKSLHSSGAIAESLEILQKNGDLYQKDDALFFKSTAYGDDKDRVIRKNNGELTYAAADIAYLQDKADRGYARIIMVLGHDHHSYATRLQGILRALGLAQNHTLDIILYQLVHLKESGQAVQMSKRTGKMVTLSDIIQAVGTDVARFFYLNRKADAQLEFDLDLALKKTEENPVYYIQYAYVRTKSILQKAHEIKVLSKFSAHDIQSLTAYEQFLIKKIVHLKILLADIAVNTHTHILAYYAQELAQVFHKFYAKHRVIDESDIGTSKSRLVITAMVRDTFKLVFDLLGISAPDKM